MRMQHFTTSTRRARPFNPPAPEHATLIEAVSRGEFTINGFRDRDLRALLFDDPKASKQEQRHNGAAASRKLALPRAHRFINIRRLWGRGDGRRHGGKTAALSFAVVGTATGVTTQNNTVNLQLGSVFVPFSAVQSVGN